MSGPHSPSDDQITTPRQQVRRLLGRTMIGSAPAGSSVTAEGFSAMTRIEMEHAINNLDHRLALVERIVPTLASKQDLHEAFEEAKRHTSVLVEDVRDDIR